MSCVERGSREYWVQQNKGADVLFLLFFRAIYFAAYSKSKETFNGIFVPNSGVVHMSSAGFAGEALRLLRNIYATLPIPFPRTWVKFMQLFDAYKEKWVLGSLIALFSFQHSSLTPWWIPSGWSKQECSLRGSMLMLLYSQQGNCMRAWHIISIRSLSCGPFACEM